MVLIYFTPNRNGYGTIFINIQNGYHTSIELKDLWQTSKEKRKLFPFHPIKKRSTLCLKQIFIQKKTWRNGSVQEDQISKENNPPMEKRCHSQELELTYMKRYKSINFIHLMLNLTHESDLDKHWGISGSNFNDFRYFRCSKTETDTTKSWHF